ncbi:MAG: 2-dehydropantoate 2-reductase [Desulfobacteraceae bacterium]|nr:2-dehydropantoate 2-reductase [Desulfobacteraceae bacterium]
MNREVKPKIAIIGAGAIGSLIGGIWSRDGYDVTLVARQAHVAAIQRDGLRINGVAGNFIAWPRAREALDFAPDMAVISVKNQDVGTACQAIKPFIGNIPVVMAQNGVAGAEMAAAHFNKANLISCTLVLNARFMSPGQVTFVNKSPIVIGKAFAANDASVTQLQSLFKRVAPTSISDNILGVQWAKLLVNAMTNGLDGLTGQNMGQYLQSPKARRVGIMILKEAFQLTRRAGLCLQPLPGLPLWFFKFVSVMPAPISSPCLKLVAKAKGDKNIITSTLQSLLKGQLTEIDFLNGEFVRLGQRIGVPAPVNAKVVSLIHAIEKTKQFYTPEALFEHFSHLDEGDRI